RAACSQPQASNAHPEIAPELLTQLMDFHAGNVSQVARELGITRYELWGLMQGCGIDPKCFAQRADIEKRAQVVKLMRVHGGNIARVARALHIARFQLRCLLRRYGLDSEDPSEPESPGVRGSFALRRGGEPAGVDRADSEIKRNVDEEPTP